MTTPKAGDVFLHELVLPGEPSGGKHLCVCLSRVEYAQETGMAVLASLRRVRSSWWRPLVDLPDYAPRPGFLPLDGPRAVDTSQMMSVSTAALSRVAGVVTERVVSETMAVYNPSMIVWDHGRSSPASVSRSNTSSPVAHAAASSSEKSGLNPTSGST